MFQFRFDPKTPVVVVAPEGARAPKDFSGDGNLTFVWGTLMSPEFIRNLLGHYVAFAPAILKGYRRSATGKTFSLRRQAGGVVSGVALIGLSSEDVKRLNDFEEIPTVMVRKRTAIQVGDRKMRAFIYLERR